MQRSIYWMAASLLLVIFAITQAGEDTKAMKIIARANWPFAKADPDGPKKGEQVVLRSAAELAARSPWSELDANAQVVEKMAAAQVAKLLKVEAIDWDKQMLILVTAGPRPTGGWKVNVDSIKRDGKALKVEWSVAPPSGFATQAFTHPGQVVLVERIAGPVTFKLTEKKPKE